MKSHVAPLCAGLALSFVAAFAAVARAQNAPPPPPPKLTAAATSAPAPAASPTPAPAVKIPVPAAKPSATPAPPKEDANRVGISGVWEVQIQDGPKTTYTHFKLTQKESVLTGEYLDKDGKKAPLAGSIDGKQVRIVVTLAGGGSISFTGSVDNLTDMLGMLDANGSAVPFTAAYRPKYKWLDNINPAAGALGGGTP